MKSTPILLATLVFASFAGAKAGDYVVRPGDTLSAIAVRNHTTVKALLRENGIADANRIRAGQTLRLPAPPAPAAAAPAPAPAKPVPAPAAAPAPAPAAPAPAAVAPAAPPPAAARREASVLREESFYDVWIRDRLSLGLSLSWNRLTDGDRPRDLNRKKTFLGYINKLDEDNEWDWAPSVSWLASDFVRLGLTWNAVEARTKNCNLNPETGTSLSDGVVSAEGPLLLVEGAYPLEGGVWRPHAGLGIGWYKGDFSEDAWWRLDYAGPKSWAAAGKPGNKTASGRYRAIDVDDAFGFVFSAGVAWRPIPEFELDLSLRKSWLEPDCSFSYVDATTGKRDRQMSGEFTLDTLSVVLTAAYVF